VSEIKKRLGQDFPVIALVNIAEYGDEKATTVEEGVQFAKLLQDAGADVIQVRAHGYGHRGGLLHPDRLFYPEPPKSLPKDLDWSRKGVGATIPLVTAVKKVVSIPVFTACRLDPGLGEELLRQGKLDFVGMTRRLLADPELPNKVAAGRLEDINPCTGCLYCMDVRLHNSPVRCRVNANLGREREFALKPAAKPKRVMVVGGGPAGMEAARVAALRGHKVTLYEKEPKLGGLIPLAALLKDVEIEDLLALVRYLKTQIKKAGVTLRLGREVTPSVLKEFKPDVVFLATGGKHAVADIRGINRRNVASSSVLHRKLKSFSRFVGPKSLAGLTKLWMPIGRRVVVIGGTMHGCELAEFLIKRGRRVTIVHSGETVGEGMTGDDRFQFLRWVADQGVIMTGVTFEDITDKGLVISTAEGKKQTVEADTVVIALPLLPDTEALQNLAGNAPEIHAIGDCREPNQITDAIADGSRLAHTI
jgi:2,4-dienoyl-CoA reductase (NADPH2)